MESIIDRSRQSNTKKCRYCSKQIVHLVAHILKMHEHKIFDEIQEVLGHYSAVTQLNLLEGIVEPSTSICKVRWNNEEKEIVCVSSKRICNLPKFRAYIKKINHNKCPCFFERDVNEFLRQFPPTTQCNTPSRHIVKQKRPGQTRSRTGGEKRSRNVSPESDDCQIIDVIQQPSHNLSAHTQASSCNTTDLEGLLLQSLNSQRMDQFAEEIAAENRQLSLDIRQQNGVGIKSHRRRQQHHQQSSVRLSSAFAALDDDSVVIPSTSNSKNVTENASYGLNLSDSSPSDESDTVAQDNPDFNPRATVVVTESSTPLPIFNIVTAARNDRATTRAADTNYGIHQQRQSTSNSTHKSEEVQQQTDSHRSVPPSDYPSPVIQPPNIAPTDHQVSVSEHPFVAPKESSSPPSFDYQPPNALQNRNVSRANQHQNISSTERQTIPVPQKTSSLFDDITRLMDELESPKHTSTVESFSPRPLPLNEYVAPEVPSAPPAFNENVNVPQNHAFDYTNQQGNGFLTEKQPPTTASDTTQLDSFLSNTNSFSTTSSSTNHLPTMNQVPQEPFSVLDQINRLLDDSLRPMVIDDEALEDLRHVIIGDYNEYKNVAAELSLFHPHYPITFTKFQELLLFMENGGTPSKYFSIYPSLDTVQKIFTNGFYIPREAIFDSVKAENEKCLGEVADYITKWKEQMSKFCFLMVSTYMTADHNQNREVPIRSFSSNVACFPLSPTFKEINLSFNIHRIIRQYCLPGTNVQVKSLLMIFVGQYGNVVPVQKLQIQPFRFGKCLNELFSALTVYDAFGNEKFKLKFYRNLGNTVFLYEFPDKVHVNANLNVRFLIDFANFGAVSDGSCLFGQIINCLSVIR